MTAVLNFVVGEKCPIILGDILLSGSPISDNDLKTPTSVNIHDIFPTGSKIVPTKLQQKVVLLSDNLVLGWSGNYMDAKEILRELNAACKDTKFSVNDLDMYFKSVPESVWKKGFGVVGFIKDQGGFTRFGYNYESRKTERFGKVGFLGSGADDLDEIVSQFCGESLNIVDGNPNILELSISYGFSISGTLLNMELATHQSLQNFYGGGYEIASLIKGKFQKLDGVVYCFWKARISDKGVHISQVPLHSMSFGYEKDVLLIRSMSFNENKKPLSIQESGFAISPMTRIVTKDEIYSFELPTLNQKFLCNYFLVTPLTGKPEIYARIDFRPKIDRELLFYEEKDKTIVAVSHEFIESVGKEIFKRFSI